MAFVRKNKKRGSRRVLALVANAAGEIMELPGYGAVGLDGVRQVPLSQKNTIPLPHGGELMYLPDRIPLVYDFKRGRVRALRRHPHYPEEKIYPVAAFNSPGFVLWHTAAFEERPKAKLLPLFSYGAVGWQGGEIRSSIIQVDKEPRQDLRRMPQDKILAGIRRQRRAMPDNRLRAHLENCALTYGCPAGKNFFLQRYEAPLPTSQSCNARCLGCISLQSEGQICHSQDRITFTPSPREIAEVALAHIDKVPKAVVSFGQGCEGDPLMAAEIIAEAVRLIRKATDKGTINMNTNASLPKVMRKLYAAGLDSIRVSLNSVRETCYSAYFRPKGYTFDNVLESIAGAAKAKVHVAVNYLNCPGFTDTPQEAEALFAFLSAYPIGLIQWRNLNYDPLRYMKLMSETALHDSPLGMDKLLAQVHERFPKVKFGYFNPPKENF